VIVYHPDAAGVKDENRLDNLIMSGSVTQ